MRLYVGNLSGQTTEQQLGELFTEHGAVTSVKVVMDAATGQSRGFGFVEMSEDGARVAMAALNNKNVGDRQLTVSEARARPAKVGSRR